MRIVRKFVDLIVRSVLVPFNESLLMFHVAIVIEKKKELEKEQDLSKLLLVSLPLYTFGARRDERKGVDGAREPR